MITYPAPEPARLPIPKSIRSALLKALSYKGEVVRDATNTHGGYEFASVDAVYESAREILTSVGLGLLLTELSCIHIIEEKRVRFVFQWTLFTEEDEWTDATAVRTIVLPYTGPQTCQAAQSYVEKAILKHLLKLKTGDKEPEDAGLPGVDLKAAKAQAEKAKAPKLDGLATKSLLDKIHNDIKENHAKGLIGDPDGSAAFSAKWSDQIKGLDEHSKATIRGWLKGSAL